MTSKEYFFVAVIIILAFLLRFIGAGVPALNGDEADNLDSILNILVQGISPWQRWGGLLPPMAIWISTVFVYFFGPLEWALRLYGAVLGSLTVGVIYFLARLQFDKKTAAYAAVLAMVMPLLVLSNRDAHPDNALVFFSLVSILCFEYGQKSNARWWYYCGGIFAGLAIISKYNASVLLSFYLIFAIVYAGKKEVLKKTKTGAITAVLCIATIMVTLIGRINNLFYFIYGILFWIFNQSIGVRMPWYYSISVLFDGLSPAVFIFLPVAAIILATDRKRNSLLNIWLCFSFLTVVTLQGRKFPRHFLLAVPFVVIIVSAALFNVRDRIHKKIMMSFMMILLIVGAAGWSLYKINAHQQYTVWKDVGAFILEHTNKNDTVFIDGVEFWSLKFYTKYERKIVSRLDPGLLTVGNIVVVHDLNKTTPFFLSSPLQNDLTLYSEVYAENPEHYPFNASFYAHVASHGHILKTFDYDALGNRIIVYVIDKISVHNSENKNVSRPIVLDLTTQKICEVWKSCGLTKRILKKIVPKELQEIATKKCTQGCVTTCDVF